ncbi:MAG: Maf family protein [Candidatus Cybelea sp.]
MNGRTPLSRIVLASESPRRLELLRSLGLIVDVAASGYAEVPLPGVSPAGLASHHANEKLRAALQRRPLDTPVLAADTVVDLDGTPLGKPHDLPDAARMLESLSGREHVVHTAFALAVPGIPQWVAERSSTRVRFYRLEASEIADYLATGEPLDKAGAYGIQGRAASLVEAIEGDFYTVMGLPLARVVRTLRGLGFTLPTTK